MKCQPRSVCRLLAAAVVLLYPWTPRGLGAYEPPLLRIGTSGDYPPFSETVEGGFRGFDIAVAEAFARDVGYEPRWVSFRWPELSGALAAGRFDVAMSGVTVRPDRSIAGRFTLPVAQTGAVLLVRESVASKLAPGGVAGLDVAKLRVAVNAGGHLERVTRRHLGAASIRAIPDNAAVPQALASGEVDAVVTDTLEAPHWLARLSGVVMVGPFTRDWKAYWLTAEDDDLAARLDAWLLARERDGTLAALRAEWFEGPSMAPTATPLQALLAACDERLALMPFVAGDKRSRGLPVVDAEREARVLEAATAAVERAARRLSLEVPDPARVHRFYRAQIDAAVAVQRAVLMQPEVPELARFDLASQLRPALLRIGARMAGLLVALAQADTDPSVVQAEVERALARHDLSAEHLAAIADAIATLAPVSS